MRLRIGWELAVESASVRVAEAISARRHWSEGRLALRGKRAIIAGQLSERRSAAGGGDSVGSGRVYRAAVMLRSLLLNEAFHLLLQTFLHYTLRL